MEELLKTKWESLRSEFINTLVSVNRPVNECKIVVVTKFVDIHRMNQILQLGAQEIGESRVQETQNKKPLIENSCKWHLIGSLQTNKVKFAVNLFDSIQSVDRVELIHEIGKKLNDLKKPLELMIQVNVSGKSSQSGCKPENVEKLVELMLNYPFIKLTGFMCIASQLVDVGDRKLRSEFALLRFIYDQIKFKYSICSLQELSMGMSDDWKIAISEGSTMIRIGSYLFGSRG